ncbi:integrin alpha-PS2 isoform X1 [Periplaneta americana]|uniref:integrin alpha-PS2 isoform X1 n=1 Tax=Periplaneta americana TaxID=6978 RepID=UPI0037E77AB1
MTTVRALLLWALLGVAAAFNVDTEHVIRHRGAPGSMFGFSVAPHRDRGASWVLVGAPEAQTSQPGVRRGGAVYRCDASRSDACQELPFDVTGNNNNSEGRQIDLKSGQWFGATVQSSGENGVVLACAPRYVWFSQTPNRRDPVGTCYVARDSFREYSEYSPCRTRQWGHHRQGSCQAGLGASVSKDGARIYLGAVGSWYWQGQVYSQSLGDRLAFVSTKEGSAVDDDSYLGYSVAVGDFGDGEGGGAAVGMPRGSGLLGKVVLYSWNLTNHLNLTGEQLGAYFGYALCVSDLDGDGRDDLVVGAPLYTDLSNNKGFYETGRIYIFYQGMRFRDRFRGFHIRDGKNSRSRFGLSLTTLHDINKDGYGDIAVGAPYDGPEGRGAVYVFHGSRKGIQEKHSQLITAEELNTPISTFGFSVAGGVDLDENEYPDLVVGAYEADTAIFLRARPVVKLKAYVNFRNDSKQISLDTKGCTLRDRTQVVCTNLSACLEYSGVGVDRKLDFEVQFLLDSKKPKSPRLFFLSQPGSNALSYTLRLDKDALLCKTYTVYIKEDIRDKLTPLEAEMRYTLAGRRRVTRSLVPILDQSQDAVRRDSISIQKNCGPDNICIPDLQLSVTPGVKRYLVGTGERLVLDVVVENQGEDSFETTFMMGVPPGINYINYEQHDEGERAVFVQCSGPSPANNHTLRCDLGNPLPQRRIVRFNVYLKPSLADLLKPRYDFLMTVNSTNPEEPFTTDDNSFRLSIPMWVDAELLLEGMSEPRDLHYNLSQYSGDAESRFASDIGPPLVHTYTITNEGPSDLIEAEAYFVWPSHTFVGEHILYLFEMPTTDGPVSCELLEDAKINPLALRWDRKKKLEAEQESGGAGVEGSGTRVQTSQTGRGGTRVQTSHTEGGSTRVQTSHTEEGSTWVETSHSEGGSTRVQTSHTQGGREETSHVQGGTRVHSGHGGTVVHTGHVESGAGHRGTVVHTGHFENGTRHGGTVVHTGHSGHGGTVVHTGQAEGGTRVQSGHGGTVVHTGGSVVHTGHVEGGTRVHVEEGAGGGTWVHEDRRLTTLTDEERRRYEEEQRAYEEEVRRLQAEEERLRARGGSGSWSSNYSSSWSGGHEVPAGGVLRHYNWASNGSDVTFSTETSDISDRVGASYSNQLEESARGTGGFRHYVWSPDVSTPHGSSGLDVARGHIGTDSHVGIETDNAGVGFETRRGQHGGSQSWSSSSSWTSGDPDAWRSSSEQHWSSSEGGDGQLKLYRKYNAGEGGRRRRRDVGGDAQLRQATQCNTTHCSRMRCTLGPLAKGDAVELSFKFVLWASTIQSIAYNSPMNLSTLLATRLTRLPYIGAPEEESLRTREEYTEVVPTDTSLRPEIVPLWIVVLSACAGALILLLLIFLLWKCGFFKRNRPSNAPEKQPLNRNGHYEPGDEAL